MLVRGEGLAQTGGLDLFACVRRVFELEMATELVMFSCCPFLFELAGGADFT